MSTRQTTRGGTVRLAGAAVLALGFSVGVDAQDPLLYPCVTEKKVIECGWDTPTARFVKDNIAQ